MFKSVLYLAFAIKRFEVEKYFFSYYRTSGHRHICGWPCKFFQCTFEHLTTSIPHLLAFFPTVRYRKKPRGAGIEVCVLWRVLDYMDETFFIFVGEMEKRGGINHLNICATCCVLSVTSNPDPSVCCFSICVISPKKTFFAAISQIEKARDTGIEVELLPVRTFPLEWSSY